MKIHKYASEEEYRRIQSEWMKRKETWRYVTTDECRAIAETCRRVIGQQDTYKVLCHGVRNGAELQDFALFFPCKNKDIVGTEISDRGSRYPNVVVHDFHDQKYEWIRQFDVVYSNSLDHAHSPDVAVKAWCDQVRIGGVLALHWSEDSLPEKMSECDCFGASLSEYVKLLPPNGRVTLHPEGLTRQGTLVVWKREV